MVGVDEALLGGTLHHMLMGVTSPFSYMIIFLLWTCFFQLVLFNYSSVFDKFTYRQSITSICSRL